MARPLVRMRRPPVPAFVFSAPRLVFLVLFLAATALAQNSTLQVSVDGTCGGATNQTCIGSTWGQCCSAHGYCGSTDTYCGQGCNAAFGKCEDKASSTGPGVPSPTAPAPSRTCPVCPVCKICMSPTPTEVPSSCRVILTATHWVTLTATVNGGGSAGAPATPAPTTAASQTACPSAAIHTTTVVASTTVVSTTTLTQGGPAQTKTETTTETKTDTKTETRVLQTQTDTHTVTTTLTQTSLKTITLVSTVTSGGGTGPSRTSTDTAEPTPSPFLPGVVRYCRQWYKTVEGDTCRSVAGRASISQDDLRKWNTKIGSTTDETTICQRGQLVQLATGLCRIECGSLWPGYYLCVGG